MIRNSAIGVCVKNNNNSNVMVNSDIIIHQFQQLSTIVKIGFNSYSKNTFISKYFFFKSIVISFLIFFYLYSNNYNLQYGLFSGLTIQLIKVYRLEK